MRGDAGRREHDEAWRRGFAEPDVEDEDPSARERAPHRISPTDASRSRPGAFAGVDDKGAVMVTVDHVGLVADVAINANWRAGISESELGRALLTAVNNATYELVADRFQRLNAASPLPATPTAPIVSRPDHSMLPEMLDLISRFDHDIGSYCGRLESMVHATATATGPNGKVTVSLDRGRVVEVTADARWAARTGYTEIRYEALGAFRAVTLKVGNTDISSVQKAASLVRLEELAIQQRPGRVAGNRSSDRVVTSVDNMRWCHTQSAIAGARTISHWFARKHRRGGEALLRHRSLGPVPSPYLTPLPNRQKGISMDCRQC
jgi:hypothetical protein